MRDSGDTTAPIDDMALPDMAAYFRPRGPVPPERDFPEPLDHAGWFVNGRLKMRQLLLLLAIDEHRSILRAADTVHMTQPAASRQIIDLESALGVKLFHRMPRGMIPTPYGEAIIRRVRVAMNTLKLAHGDVMALRAGIVGKVEIGTIVTPALGVVPRAVALAKAESPGLRIGVHVESSHVLLERLRAGTLDVVIGRLDDNADGLTYEALSDETYCVVARSGHPWLAHATLTLRDLVDAPWILPPTGTMLRTRLEQAFRREGLAPPGNLIESTSIPLIISLLQETGGLYFMPVEMATWYGSLGVLGTLPVKLTGAMDAFGLIRKQDELLSRGAALVLARLREQARASGWLPR